MSLVDAGGDVGQGGERLFHGFPVHTRFGNPAHTQIRLNMNKASYLILLSNVFLSKPSDPHGSRVLKSMHIRTQSLIFSNFIQRVGVNYMIRVSNKDLDPQL